MKPRVLVVEDDRTLLRGLLFNLKREGYGVVGVETAAAAQNALQNGAFDLMLLDLNLPDREGTEVLKQLRAEGWRLPVICLTARRAEADVVMGFHLGADDYVTKPFSLAELLARVAARLRRDLPACQKNLRLGPAEVDWEARLIRRRGQTLQLTPQETELLHYLADRLGQAVDRQDLLRDLWGLQGIHTTRTLDNHIARLRRKLEEDPAHPRHLVTVHGVGYRLQREIL